MTGTSIVDLPTLIAAAKNFGNRIDSSVANAAGDFVRLGEELVWMTNENGVLRSQNQGIKQSSLVIPAGQNYQTLPADFLAMRRLSNPANLTGTIGGDTSRLDRIDADELEDMLAPGDPTVYAIEGGRVLYGQTNTASATTLLMRYFFFPGYLGSVPPLGGAAITTHWALQALPGVFLYATLLAMALYVKKMDAVGQYGAILDKSIAGFHSQERAGMEMGGSIRYRRSRGS